MLDTLKKKVDKFETDLKKLWIYAHEENKSNIEKVKKLQELGENIEFVEAGSQSKIEVRESQFKPERWIIELSFMKSQEMRNNLFFGDVTENTSETLDDTEHILRKHFVGNLKIAQDPVDGLKIECDHRIAVRRGTNS